MDGSQPQKSDAEDKKLHSFPGLQFRPSFVFRAYNSPGAKPQQDAGLKGAGILHSQVSRPLIRLTKEITDTYAVCNPTFQYSKSCNPKKYFTVPSVGVSNNGSDNENHDLILYSGRVLANEDKTRRYVVKDIVGCGSFGQVAKCLVPETKDFVAVKVIKNQRAYSTQARVEIAILHKLNNLRDWRNNNRPFVKYFDYFSCEGHICIVFELLGINLFELLKKNGMKGISLPLVRTFTAQLLDALRLLYDARIIHSDLKPENILLSGLCGSVIKLIDFGSACMDERTVYSYIQSRFYRSPEVVLGHPYSRAIDMWSLGCVAAELFLGLPLFPGQCPYDLLRLMIEKLGKQPPGYILRNAKNTNKYFKLISAAPQEENGHASGNASVYQFLTPDENERREGKKPVIGRGYISGSLDEMIINHPTKPSGKEEMEKEMFNRKVFIDFLRGLIELDPSKRWTPHEASQHPFLTEGPFRGPFRPRKEVTPVATSRALSVEHKGRSGVSPNVGKMILTTQVNGGQQFKSLPLTIADSPARFGGFADSGASGSSFRGIGRGALPSMSNPPSLNGQNSLSAGSSDFQWHHIQPKQSTGHTQLGMSPSAIGLQHLSIGASPSHQFHTSGPHFLPSHGSHISSLGSQYMASPGTSYQERLVMFQSSPESTACYPQFPSQYSPRYGPPSSAYAAIKFNQQHNPGLAPVPPPSNGSGEILYGNVLLARLHQNNVAANADVSSGNFAHLQGGPHMSPQWRASRSGGNMGMFDQQQLDNAFLTEMLGAQLSISENTEVGEDGSAVSGGLDSEFREEPSGQGSDLIRGSNQASFGGRGRGQRRGRRQRHRLARARDQENHANYHQHLSGSSLYRPGMAADTGRPIGDRLLSTPQIHTRGFYAADANSGHPMGLVSAGFAGAGIIPDGRGLPMASGFNQQNVFGVGAPSCPAQNPLFTPDQIYPPDQSFAGRTGGPSSAGCSKPPPTGKGADRFHK